MSISLMTICSTLLIVLSIAEVAARRSARLQNDIFYVALLLAYFLYVIKYYYGPDIRSYVPFYEQIAAPCRALQDSSNEELFEPAFVLLCSIMHSLKLPFYALTFVITTLYFTAIYKVLKLLPSYRTLALTVVLVLDSQVVMVALRQSASIAFFIFMCLAFRKRDYLQAAIFALLTVLMHKAGAFVVAPLVVFMLLHERTLAKWQFLLVAAILITFAFVSITNLFDGISKAVPMSGVMQKSIDHHLVLARRVQTILAVYSLALVVLFYFVPSRKATYRNFGAVALVGLFYIACFYQYFYFLNRIRSFFLPILTVYVIYFATNVTPQSRVRISALVRQCSFALIVVFLIHQVISVERGYQTYVSKIYYPCTVFDLRRATQHSLRDAQMSKAEIFWEKDFMSNEQNKVKK